MEFHSNRHLSLMLGLVTLVPALLCLYLAGSFSVSGDSLEKWLSGGLSLVLLLFSAMALSYRKTLLINRKQQRVHSIVDFLICRRVNVYSLREFSQVRIGFSHQFAASVLPPLYFVQLVTQAHQTAPQLQSARRLGRGVFGQKKSEVSFHKADTQARGKAQPSLSILTVPGTSYNRQCILKLAHALGQYLNLPVASQSEAHPSQWRTSL